MAESKTKSRRFLADIQSGLSDFCLDNTSKIQETRRICETFRIMFDPWKQHRTKVIDCLAFLAEVVSSLSIEDSYPVILESSIELREYLMEDIQMVQGLISIFDKYLENAVALKLSAQKVILSDLPAKIIYALKTDYMDHYSTLKLSEENRCDTMGEFIPLLKLLVKLAGTTGASPTILETTADNFGFLSFHWDILNELSRLNEDKGPIMNVLPMPERFLNTSTIDETPRYYDLTSNMSVCSCAIALLDTFMFTSEEVIESRRQELGKKLHSLEMAMTNRMYRMGAIAELMVTET